MFSHPAVGAAFGRLLLLRAFQKRADEQCSSLRRRVGRPRSIAVLPPAGEAPAKRVMRENVGLQQAVETEETGGDLPHLPATLTSSPAGGGTVLRVSPPAVGAHHDAPVTRISVGRGPFVNGPYGIDAAFHAKRTRLRFSVGDGVLDVPTVWGRKRATGSESMGSLHLHAKTSHTRKTPHIETDEKGKAVRSILPHSFTLFICHSGSYFCRRFGGCLCLFQSGETHAESL